MSEFDDFMIRDHIADLVTSAVDLAIADGLLPDIPFPEPDIERPKETEHGDYATSLPLRFARSAGKKPMEIAEIIVNTFAEDPIIFAPEVSNPGFLNFRLTTTWLQEQVEVISEKGENWADLNLGQGSKIQIEFVSANPTGPLHVGNGRGAAIGDTLAAVLTAAGYDVSREYYINDAGSQSAAFVETLYARYQQILGRDVALPENGYPGEYMIEIAQKMVENHGEGYLAELGMPPDVQFGEHGTSLMVEYIRNTLSDFGVQYDTWFSESTLYEEGIWDEVKGILGGSNQLIERENALWFTSSELGEDKDNVVIRSDGRPTYYASDIAYHFEKFAKRNFSRVIDVWGADHHGHVERLKIATNAVVGHECDLQVLLYQLVTLKRGDEIVRLSKRSGEIITLDELIEEVGSDAARFFFLLRSPNAQMEFDLELAVKKSNENPVYYIQYAHARMASILERAREDGRELLKGDVNLLQQAHELALIRQMLRLPEVIEQVAKTSEPHHLARYAIDFATAFHIFNDAFKQLGDPSMKVLTDDPELTAARLKLVSTARSVLARCLQLLGMSAPERM